MNRAIAASLALCAVGLTGSVSNKGAQIFAPGVISTLEYESHPTFSPDGRLLLFVKSNPDFGEWKIYQSKRSRSGWAAPVPASFSGNGFDADPYFSPDGRTLYFISTRTTVDKPKKDLDVWKVSRKGDDWGTPERLSAPINSPAAEWFPRPQRDGSVFFGSDREGGFGATDIYRAARRHRNWSVENLGASVNSADDEYEFEVSPDGKSAIMMAARKGGAGGDLYLLRRLSRGWSSPRRLNSDINGPGLEVGPLYCRDGKTLYFSSRRTDKSLGDIYSIPTSALRGAH